MMEHYIFAFTAGVVFLSVLKLISIMAGNTIRLPFYGQLDPAGWAFMYPSILYQSWYWSGVLIFN